MSQDVKCLDDTESGGRGQASVAVVTRAGAS